MAPDGSRGVGLETGIRPTNVVGSSRRPPGRVEFQEPFLFPFIYSKQPEMCVPAAVKFIRGVASVLVSIKGSIN